AIIGPLVEHGPKVPDRLVVPGERVRGGTSPGLHVPEAGVGVADIGPHLQLRRKAAGEVLLQRNATPQERLRLAEGVVRLRAAAEHAERARPLEGEVGRAAHLLHERILDLQGPAKLGLGLFPPPAPEEEQAELVAARAEIAAVLRLAGEVAHQALPDLDRSAGLGLRFGRAAPPLPQGRPGSGRSPPAPGGEPPPPPTPRPRPLGPPPPRLKRP